MATEHCKTLFCLFIIATDLISIPVSGQSTEANFTIDPSVCLKQSLEISNQSTGADRYLWDFCLTDIQQSPDYLSLGAATLISGPGAIEAVNEGDSWYVFIPGRTDDNLYKIHYPQGLTGPFTITNLGNLGGTLSQPKNLKLVKDGGEWVGLVLNVTSSIVRLRFPAGLGGLPISQNLGNLGGMSAPIGLDLVSENGAWIALVSSYSAGISIIHFGTSLLSNPSPANIFSFPYSPVSGSVGIALVQDFDGKWRGLISSYNDGRVYKISFEGGLTQQPTFTLIQTLTGPTETRMVREGASFFGFVVSQTGNLIRINFGSSIADTDQSSDDLGNFGNLANLDAFSLTKSKGVWHAFAVNRNTSDVGCLIFESNCKFILQDTSTSFEPQGVLFEAPGTFWISLEATNNAGARSVQFKSVEVRSQVSPDISFTTDKLCLGSIINFSSTNNANLEASSFNWKFGSVQTSNLEFPQVAFPATGTYEIDLLIEFENFCKSRHRGQLTIYPPPSASFSVPSSIICTNNESMFSNSTTDVYDGNLSYQWYINNDLVGTQRDLAYTFTTGGGKDVKLVASIPGCSDEAVQTIPNVGEGPTVDFQTSGKCSGEQVSFTNQSTGDIAAYEWDLGGTTSSDINPVIGFNDFGVYTIKLKAIGTNGCTSETSEPLTIYSTPQPSFSLALPPFSCSGTPAQFTDNTLAPTDSNLATWAWSFGTGPTATSSQQNPSFTYASAGTYNVGLTVSTDQGCSGTLEKSVAILPSPTIDFTNGPACRNQATPFTATTTASIKSYQWTIGANTYTVANPTHVFGAPGVNTVQLRVVAQNDCVASISRTIQVPAELVPDFSVANACAGQTITLTNTTSAPNDPVSAIQWLINNQSRQGSPISVQLANPGTYPVRMQLRGESGCSYVLNRDLVIHPSPRAAFIISDDVGPPPFRVSFTNTSQGANTYVWRFNEGSGGSSTSANPEFTFNALGTYGVDLIAFNAFNCSDQITQQVRVVTPLPDLEMLDYRVVQDPVTKLWVNQIDIRNNSNYTIRETPLLLNLGVGIMFREVVREEWRSGMVRTVTLQNQLQSNQPLSFACAELALPGDLQPANNKICVALGESTIWLAPYPNPANQFITVPLITQTNEPVTIRLIHSTGAVAYEKVVDQGEAGLREWTLSVANLSNGIYTLVVQTKDGERISRVLINR